MNIKFINILLGILIFSNVKVYSQIPIIPQSVVQAHAPIPIPSFTTIINTDFVNNSILTANLGAVELRLNNLRGINKSLQESIDHVDSQLNKKYTKNKEFDKSKSYRAKSAALLAIVALFEEMVLDNKLLQNRYGITNSKKRYLKGLQKGKLSLLALQNVQASNITMGNRQTLYRQRDDMLRNYTKSLGLSRNEISLPAMKFIIKNNKSLLKLLALMEISKITNVTQLLSNIQNNDIYKYAPNANQQEKIKQLLSYSYKIP